MVTAIETKKELTIGERMAILNKYRSSSEGIALRKKWRDTQEKYGAGSKEALALRDEIQTKEDELTGETKPKPRVEKPPRLTVRAKTYRGEAGYTVKGEMTDIFFSKESQAREYVKRVKAGEKPDKVLSDIWGIKQVRSGYTVADLIRIHAKRSPLSRASDERLSHQVTIDASDPKARAWVNDPGRADITGIDTPRLGRKSPRITPKTPRLRR